MYYIKICRFLLFCLLCFRLLIDYTDDRNNPDGRWRGYIFAISMFLVAFTQSIAIQQYFHIVFTLGMKIRTAVIGMVYAKVLDRISDNLNILLLWKNSNKDYNRYKGYFMAARGYEFYLLVLKVSLSTRR